MAQALSDTRWQTDGKFFRRDGARFHPAMVTYGPFPGGWPQSFSNDFDRIAAAGFDGLRLYEMPSKRLLDAAARAGLRVFGGLNWEQNADFIGKPSRLSAAQVELVGSLAETGNHPALAGVYVGNEIPSDLVRWMGPTRVLQAIERLIELGRELAPQLLFAYANYPSTEYLEPGNADFTAFNVYLEDEKALRSYLGRLHHIAGDRPLVISEFGLDSHRNGCERQAELLSHAIGIAREVGVAGFTTYAWSDRWLSGGIEVHDWDFGLTDREGRDKPALAAVEAAGRPPLLIERTIHRDALSVIVCTRNGRGRIEGCLQALAQSEFRHGFQTIVVDDGSTDGTAEFVEHSFPGVEILRLPPSGLSAARNAGARLARADVLAFTDDDCVPDREWLERVRDFLDSHPECAAVGGPNLPQKPRDWREAVVCAAPGAPSHVMLDDVIAEHLPGCNLVVRREAFEEIGGFDPRFHTAGDDVDFCWRLQDAGHRLGFEPTAFVWHWRRPTLRAYLRQQMGYGRAEKLLLAKHPQRFNHDGSARWEGFIYGGAPRRVTRGAVIYHGEMGRADYQSLVSRMQPLRDIGGRFRHAKSLIALALIHWLAPALRGWCRTGRLRSLLPSRDAARRPARRSTTPDLSIAQRHRNELIELLLAGGWSPCGSTETWDLHKDGTRVQLATELGEGGARRTLVRVEGDLSVVSRALGL